MASTTSLTSSFGGKATDFYLSALLEGKTLSTAGITIDNDVQYKYVVRGLDMANIIQTGETCSWNGNGSTTVTESVKDVQPFYINKTECVKDWKANWNGVSKDSIPAEVEEKLAIKTKDSIQAKIETDLWKSSITTGSTSGGTYTKNLYDGYIKLLNGVATEINLVTLSSSNIVAQLGRIYDAIPDAIKSLPNDQKVIFVSFKAEGYYRQAQISMGNNTSVGDKPLDYLGIEVRGVGIFDNVIVAGLRESFHVASNVGLDSATIDFINMGIVGEKNVRIAADFKYVPAVSNASQIVLGGF